MIRNANLPRKARQQSPESAAPLAALAPLAARKPFAPLAPPVARKPFAPLAPLAARKPFAPLAGLAALALTGCSSDPPILTVEIITGQETDAFSKDPKVTRVDVTAVAAEGDLSLKASAAPGGALDFGEVPEDRLVTFEVTGFDEKGAAVVRGRSLSGILLSAVGSDVLPVFAQRLGAWARPPSSFAATHVGAPAAALAERYLVLTGGSSALDAAGSLDAEASELYDLFGYGGGIGPSLPRAARSLVARGTALLLIDDAGATWVDFNTGVYDHITRPAELKSFAEVAGGKTIDAPDGRSFVVGPTKRDSASQAVLVVAKDGSLDALTLPAPRAGAAAVWVNGVGLVLAGGSATEPGALVLAESATAFTARPFPADATEGAGVVVTDPEQVTLVGGALGSTPAQTRTLDLRCATDCEQGAVMNAAIPVALMGVMAYAISGGRIVAVGDEASGGGMTRSFLVNVAEPSAVELPLREPRKGATTVPAPNGTLSLVGGVLADGAPALSVEMLFPE